MRLAFSIAKKFLSSNKSQAIFIITGIAVGVSVQIFVGMLIQSLQASLLDSTIGSSAHISITSSEGYIDNYEGIINELKLDENYTVVGPVIDKNLFIIDNDTDAPVLLKGISVDSESNVYNVDTKLTEGRIPTNIDEVIVGIELKNELEINIDDNIELVDTSGVNNTYKVVGIYDFNVKSVNGLWIFTNIETMHNVFSNSDSIDYIELQVEDVFEADIIATNLINKDFIEDDMVVKNWKDENAELLSGLNGQGISSLMIQIFVMLSVVLAIASVLTITVVQKSKQVGILKAMGINKRNSSLIFLFEGVILGVAGALAGIALGIILLQSFMIFAVDAAGNPIIEIFMNYQFIAISFLVSVGASVIASLVPSIKSAKLSPMEVIRNG